jgi:site-specific DNA-methyltransferase (adenine-specific)
VERGESGAVVSIEPYYCSDDGGVVVYHARYEHVIDAGLVPVRDVKLIHSDPPYGVNENTERGKNGRGFTKGRLNGGQRAARDFPPISGDDKPFDPTFLLSLDRPLVIWGGHLCQPPLPRASSWFFWGKRDGTTPDDNGDGELAWTNLKGPIREFQHLWRGTCRASETGAAHLAPTQKPIALSIFVYQRAKLKPGDLVFVPHGGSSPDLPAARAMGLRIIACDVEEWCCRTGVARLGAVSHPEPVHALGSLFDRLAAVATTTEANEPQKATNDL